MKKNWKRAVSLFVLLFCFLPAVQGFAVGPVISSAAYVVMDAKSGQVLMSQNADAMYDPASITKIMTLGLACEKAQGAWDTQVTVSHEDVYTLAGTGSSHIALQEGEVVTLEALLYATILESANDAANALASYVGGDIAGGVVAMNAQVAELGLTHTTFANPHGLSEEGHKVSAKDMADILRWAMQQEGFMELFTRHDTYTMATTNKQPKERYFSLDDSSRIGSSQYYVPEIIGSKSGYTTEAGYTHVSLAEKEGKQFICVTMHHNTKPEKYTDLETLFNYAFSHFVKVEIPASNEKIAVDVLGGGAKIGVAFVEMRGTSLYLYDGQGAENVQVTYDTPEQYILGGHQQAFATFTLPESEQQDAFAQTVPLAFEGVDAILASNVGVSPFSPQTEQAVNQVLQSTILIWAVLIGVVVYLMWTLFYKSPYNAKQKRKKVRRRLQKRWR